MNCATCQAALPELLLEPAAAQTEAVRAHLEACNSCRQELQSLQSTFALLDQWSAPEPSPWFDQRMAARLREEQATEPEGWLERLRSRLLFSTGRQLRPTLAGAFALALVLGGGAAANFSGLLQPHPPEASAAVQDLQILDRNDQTIQTMDQLLQDDSQNDDGTAAAPSS